MKSLFTTAIMVLAIMTTHAQLNWQKGGNNATPGGFPPIIGTDVTWNAPLLIHTNGIYRAQFTTGNFLTSLVGNNGDGLRIINPVAPTSALGHLDMFTSGGPGTLGGNETHINWGGSGQISGQAARFEFRAKITDGFYFNNELASGFYKFANQDVVHAFVGTNEFWRIGLQTINANIAGTRQLEVADNETQFRLRRTTAAGTNTTIFTDFEASFLGLDIVPMNGPTKTTVFIHEGGLTQTGVRLNVNGNGRFRYIPDGDAHCLILG